MELLAFCLFFITGLALYFPVVYIRKTNRLLRVLEQIEANMLADLMTRVPQAKQS